MSTDAHQKIRTLMNDLRAPSEQEVHWFTQILADGANMFPFVGVLVILMLLDILTGLVAAMSEGKVNSNCSFRGIWKKVQMLLLVASGLVFEVLYPDIPWGKVIAGLFSVTEMISIIENAGRAGLPIPIALKETLSRLKEASDTAKYIETPSVRVEIKEDDKSSVIKIEEPIHK